MFEHLVSGSHSCLRPEPPNVMLDLHDDCPYFTYIASSSRLLFGRRWASALCLLNEGNQGQAKVRCCYPGLAKAHEYTIYRRPDPRIGTSFIFNDLGAPLESVSSRIQGLWHDRGDVEDHPVSKNLEEGMTLVGPG